jgi:cathepsin A (carboxypeptidase C)/serine carboxypeptidase-like clade 1
LALRTTPLHPDAVEYKSNMYKNPLTFITIRGGRHEVPETAPNKALELVKHLVSGEPF